MTGAPLIKVPFVEPRSRNRTTPSERTTSQWDPDTEASSILKSFSGLRPSRLTPGFNAICRACGLHGLTISRAITGYAGSYLERAFCHVFCKVAFIGRIEVLFIGIQLD